MGVSLLMTNAVRAPRNRQCQILNLRQSHWKEFHTASAAAAKPAVNNAQVEYAAVSEASILPSEPTGRGQRGQPPPLLVRLIALRRTAIACGLLWKSAGNRRNDTLKDSQFPFHAENHSQPQSPSCTRSAPDASSGGADRRPSRNEGVRFTY